MATHGIIVNLSSGAPFVFQYNPVEITMQKPLTWFIAPNIGGASQEMFFSGFQNREVDLTLQFIDKQDAFGVKEEVEYFKQLGEPDAGLLSIANSFFGNENYPPPKVLYQFGVSISPLVYNVAQSPNITIGHFKSGGVAGVAGIPTIATVQLKLVLDESNDLNKAEQIAKKVEALAGSAESVAKEVAFLATGKRKEAPFV